MDQFWQLYLPLRQARDYIEASNYLYSLPREQATLIKSQRTRLVFHLQRELRQRGIAPLQATSLARYAIDQGQEYYQEVLTNPNTELPSLSRPYAGIIDVLLSEL